MPKDWLQTESRANAEREEAETRFGVVHSGGKGEKGTSLLCCLSCPERASLARYVSMYVTMHALAVPSSYALIGNHQIATPHYLLPAEGRQSSMRTLWRWVLIRVAEWPSTNGHELLYLSRLVKDDELLVIRQGRVGRWRDV